MANTGLQNTQEPWSVGTNGPASKSDSVWAGASGSTTYTVGDIVTILKSIGILAA
jgi:hypothetical protein